MDLPPDDNPDPPGLDAWPAEESPVQLDLVAEGITSIIWATGFGYNYDWIKLPVGDHRGFPIQQRGVTQWPGLYFMGLQWMYGANSAQFYGVHEDAEYVADICHLPRITRWIMDTHGWFWADRQPRQIVGTCAGRYSR